MIFEAEKVNAGCKAMLLSELFIIKGLHADENKSINKIKIILKNLHGGENLGGEMIRCMTRLISFVNLNSYFPPSCSLFYFL
jgi:hypothetical protein